jgi:pilus assembly protein CpaC
LTLPAPASTVMAADPRVVRVQPSSPTSIFLMAGAPGRTNIIATNESAQSVAEFEVTVVPPGGLPTGPTTAAPPRIVNVAAIESQLRALIPSPGQVRVRTVGRSLVLTGSVPTAADARRAEAIVRGMTDDDTTVLNELGVLASIQVNLRVRVAEISRDITRDLGFNWQVIGQAGNFAFGLRTGGISALAGGGGGSGLLGAGGTPRAGVGYSSGGWDVNLLVDALARDSLVTILAEPNLTAQSGEVASFLAGGEFPVPVSAGSNGQVGIEFKAFGVSLAFVPTVLANDRLTLRVRPEVSELSEQGAINVPIAGGSVRIPALTVRRAETTVELGSGQSFAIAGLLQRASLQSQDGVNGLVDIPVLGALFRSDRFQRRETELVIIVTPYLVQPVSDPAALTGPTDNFRPATSLERILMARQITTTPRPVPGVPQGIGFRLN